MVSPVDGSGSWEQDNWEWLNLWVGDQLGLQKDPALLDSILSLLVFSQVRLQLRFSPVAPNCRSLLQLDDLHEFMHLFVSHLRSCQNGVGPRGILQDLCEGSS